MRMMIMMVVMTLMMLWMVFYVMVRILAIIKIGTRCNDASNSDAPAKESRKRGALPTNLILLLLRQAKSPLHFLRFRPCRASMIS